MNDDGRTDIMFNAFIWVLVLAPLAAALVASWWWLLLYIPVALILGL